MTDEAKSNAYKAGWDAFWSGKDIGDNPYDNEILIEEWISGWVTADYANKHNL